MKIVIVGNYGGKNFGDEFILSALLSCLESLGICRKNISVLTFDNKYTMHKHKVNAIFYAPFTKKFYKSNIGILVSTIRNANIIIIGGGGLLEDVNPQALPHYLFPLFLGKLFRKKVVLFSIGIGPLKSKFSKAIIRNICNLVDQIYVRDKHSLLILQSLGITSLINITPDLATTFLWKKLKRELKNMENTTLPRSLKIGVSIRKIPWNLKLEKQICQFISNVLSQINEKLSKNTKIFFFCSEDDYKIVKEIISLNDNKISYRIINSLSYKLEDVLDIISEMSFFISVRLHFLIAAKICSVPCVGISYMDKIANFCYENNIPYITLKTESCILQEKLIDSILSLINLPKSSLVNNENYILQNRSLIERDIRKCLSKCNKTASIKDLICLAFNAIVLSIISIFVLLKRTSNISNKC